MTTGEIMALAHLYRNATEIAEPRKALRTAIEALVAASQGEQAKVPLTDEQIDELLATYLETTIGGYHQFARVIEQAHGIGGKEST